MTKDKSFFKKNLIKWEVMLISFVSQKQQVMIRGYSIENKTGSNILLLKAKAIWANLARQAELTDLSTLFAWWGSEYAIIKYCCWYDISAGDCLNPVFFFVSQWF